MQGSNDMIGKRSKLPPLSEQQEEKAPLWIISFCDLVLVMLGFFVIMAAGNPPSRAQYDPEYADVVASVKKAFKYVPKAGSTDPIDLRIMSSMRKESRGQGSGASGRNGQTYYPVHGQAGRYNTVTTVRTGMQTTIGGVIQFEKDSAQVTSDALPALTQIADQIRGHTNVFHVKGHSSCDEEFRIRGTSKDLGYQRARAIVQRLVALGVASESLRAVSCGAYEPVQQDAYAEEDYKVNRRVEVIATEALVIDYHTGGADIPAESSRRTLDAGQQSDAGEAENN